MKEGRAVTIRPVGGLGNQLFIWAAGFEIARRTGAKLFADLHWYSKYSHRKFELQSFDSAVRILPRSAGLLKRLSRFSPTAPGASPLFVETAVGFDARWAELVAPITLSGHFQSKRYFADSWTGLTKRLKTVFQPSAWYLQQRDLLTAIGPHISVHVRHGDYLTHPRLGVLPASYYQSALQKAQLAHSRDMPLVLHSDSPPTAKFMLQETGIRIAHSVNPKPDARPIEKLLLASQGQVQILANSTFSWWAGELSDSRDLFTPVPWFKDPGLDTSELEGPFWRRVVSWPQSEDPPEG